LQLRQAMKRFVAAALAIAIPVAVIAVVITGCCVTSRHRCDGVTRMLVNEHHAIAVSAKVAAAIPVVVAAPAAPSLGGATPLRFSRSVAQAARDVGATLRI
jgi:hypothetical protein